MKMLIKLFNGAFLWFLDNRIENAWVTQLEILSKIEYTKERIVKEKSKFAEDPQNYDRLSYIEELNAILIYLEKERNEILQDIKKWEKEKSELESKSDSL